MPTAELNNAISLEYVDEGGRDAPPILWIQGFTAQLVSIDQPWYKIFVDAGYRSLRFDNRDVGLSTRLSGTEVDLGKILVAVLGAAAQDAGAQGASGDAADSPLNELAAYSLFDMADDAVGLLDVLGIDQAHVVGLSMGGMIAQSLAIAHPQRVRSLTSVMSMTGNRAFGKPTSEAQTALMSAPSETREDHADNAVRVTRIWASKRFFDEEAVRARSHREWDRGVYPEGAARQLAAILTAPNREAQLRELVMPTLVIHGLDDQLITADGGQRTAEVVPGAALVEVEHMGHDLPQPLWPKLSSTMIDHFRSADDAT